MIYPSAYELKSFYNTNVGKAVKNTVKKHIDNLWGDCDNLRVMGYGYTAPYLDKYLETSERCFSIMSGSSGIYKWPEEKDNLVAIARGDELPIETESVDRIIMMHAIEYAYSIDDLMQEIWRILKSNGRIIAIVPNRIGFWARATWSPFGQGVPYTQYQINKTLQKNKFIIENTDRALYMPPLRFSLNIKVSDFYETYGKYIYSPLSGLHVIEASKQIYSAILKSESRTKNRRKIIIPKPAAATDRNCNCYKNDKE